MTRPEQDGPEPLIPDRVSRESVSLHVALSTVAMDGGTWLAGILERRRSMSPTNHQRTGSEPCQPKPDKPTTQGFEDMISAVVVRVDIKVSRRATDAWFYRIWFPGAKDRWRLCEVDPGLWQRIRHGVKVERGRSACATILGPRCWDGDKACRGVQHSVCSDKQSGRDTAGSGGHG
ncbi:hypothetical protein CMUS01_02339 [Colletotrichum musicola]|uniref:Uncharacterized protein n=1 Tax=Colletotrichum musicola TaxID=2175873 RepID=A0A8H6U7W5_9PEZI|nr:hypothetical protein CMUS01_02339 [Colletotrichum musicola]